MNAISAMKGRILASLYCVHLKTMCWSSENSLLIFPDRDDICDVCELIAIWFSWFVVDRIVWISSTWTGQFCAGECGLPIPFMEKGVWVRHTSHNLPAIIAFAILVMVIGPLTSSSPFMVVESWYTYLPRIYTTLGAYVWEERRVWQRIKFT